MVMNGGLTSINGNSSQFPQLKPQASQDSSALPSGPSPFPPLSASAFNFPPKEDTISLSRPSTGLSEAGPDSGEASGLPKPSLLSAPSAIPPVKSPPFAPLFAFPTVSPSFPALSAGQSSQSAFNPLSNTLNSPAQFSNSSPASAGSDNALLPSLPTVGQAGNPAQAATASTATGAAKPGVTAANQSLPVGANVLSPAEQTGKKVGDIVANALKEAPALQEKIDHIDWDALSREEIVPKLDKLQASVQPTFKRVPKFVDHKIARLFDDPQNQKLAAQFFDWLRKEPDPETLARLEEEGLRSHTGRPDRDELDVLDGPRPHRHPSLSEDDFGDDEASVSSEKRGLISKLHDKARETISNVKDKISSRSEDKMSSHSSRLGRQRDDDDFSDSSDDLDSLIRSSHGSDDFGPALRKHRPKRGDN